jgi:hypothetical protein
MSVRITNKFKLEETTTPILPKLAEIKEVIEKDLIIDMGMIPPKPRIVGAWKCIDADTPEQSLVVWYVDSDGVIVKDMAVRAEKAVEILRKAGFKAEVRGSAIIVKESIPRLDQEEKPKC